MNTDFSMKCLYFILDQENKAKNIKEEHDNLVKQKKINSKQEIFDLY